MNPFRICILFLCLVSAKSYAQDSLIESIMVQIFNHTKLLEFSKQSIEKNKFSIVNTFPDELKTYENVDSIWQQHFVLRAMNKRDLVAHPNDSMVFVYTRLGGYWKRSDSPVYFLMPNSTFGEKEVVIRFKVFYNLNSTSNFGDVHCYRFKLTRDSVASNWDIQFAEEESRKIDLLAEYDILLSDLLINDFK